MADPVPFMPYSNKLGEIEGRLDELERLKGSDGSGTSGGMTGDWKEAVDRQLGQLHLDVRALLSRGVAAAVVLALGIAGLYLYTNEKYERIEQRLTALEVQQAKGEAITNGKLDVLLERLPKK